VRADVELGSRDKKLNMMAGRWLQTKLGQTPQDIVLLPYLIGLDGRNKMSKSVGNTINLRDSAGDMFGKVMSIPDGLIVNYAELAAWFPLERIRRLKSQLARGSNPRDVKLGVAEAIVRLYHGVPRAQKARAEFVKLFSRKEVPDSIPKVHLRLKAWRPLELLAALKVTRSKSEARRLIAGRAVEVDGRTIAPSDGPTLLRRGSVVRVGKKKFFRVV
ncbi:MAG: tyrosine--tRNA ligase, partial [Patescibacteria group bacterium]